MKPIFDPKEIESNWYAHWEKQGYFKPRGTGKAFSIVIPPPNVTGTLHMGHGFQYTLMDILTRFHRMEGDQTLWQPGTDHAGIATQMVVERQLNAEHKTRQDLGREAFVQCVWDWKAKSGNTIAEQIRRLGASVDWSRERFTLDAGLSHAVTQVFVELYQQKIIYRGKRLVNWDPKLLTALSNLEVLSEEEQGHLWHIRYPIVDSKDYLVVATTRPETLLGDTAVAVHPHDPRYSAFIGKKIKLPLVAREIPIIADESIDPEFGSGCVKITPAHDFNDYAMGLRHQLPLINIFTPTAHLNENVPLDYQGLERFLARKKIIADLESQGLIEKIVPHTLMVPYGDRSSVVIEPYLTDQWYVDTQQLAKSAIDVVEKGEVRFIPETWDKTYFQWMHHIEDWCISRQLWWGHTIPAWYDATGKIYVGYDEADVRARYHLNADVTLTQDEDVLDTWFSSALWAFSSLDWPEHTKTLETFFPTSVLVTGFDIIFFWVARMIMMSLHFTKKIPFRDVYITGLIRDAEGQKMSKSKGNVLDPIDLIDGITLNDLIAKRTTGLMQPHLKTKIEKNTRAQFPEGIPALGTDALRFTYCSLANNNRNIRFEMGRIEGYRNFCNKLWNAARFVLMNTENFTPRASYTFTLSDQWILSRLHDVTRLARTHLMHYRFDMLAQCLYEFVWYTYCDWYVECAKVSLRATDSAATQYTLLFVLEQVMRLLHPIMPFITEEIWQTLSKKLSITDATIMLVSYPKIETIDPVVEEQFSWIQQIITAIRTLRSEMNVTPAKTAPILLRHIDDTQWILLQTQIELLRALAKVGDIKRLSQEDVLPQSATTLLGHIEIFIPMAGLIDKDMELLRLEKEMQKIKKDIERTEQKLKNPDFATKAPADILAKEKARLVEQQTALEKLVIQVNKIREI